MSITKRNNIHISGKGEQALLLGHGFGCDQRMWNHIVRYFEDDYRVIRFDYVGSGGSDLSAYCPIRYSILDGYAKDIVEICEALALKDIVFVGHSVSAMIGALASIQNPEYFNRLVMLVASPRYLNDSDGYKGGFERTRMDEIMHQMAGDFVAWATRFAPYLLKDSGSPQFGEEIRKTFCSMDTEIAKRFAQATFYADHRAELPRISIPTLILQCSDDPIVPLEVGEYLRAHISGSTLQTVELSGHFPQVTHPGIIARAIKSYVSQTGSKMAQSTGHDQ